MLYIAVTSSYIVIGGIASDTLVPCLGWISLSNTNTVTRKSIGTNTNFISVHQLVKQTSKVLYTLFNGFVRRNLLDAFGYDVSFQIIDPGIDWTTHLTLTWGPCNVSSTARAIELSNNNIFVTLSVQTQILLLITFDSSFSSALTIMKTNFNESPEYVYSFDEDTALSNLYILMKTSRGTSIMVYDYKNAYVRERWILNGLSTQNTLQVKYGFMFLGGTQSSGEAMITKTPLMSFDLLNSLLTMAEYGTGGSLNGDSTYAISSTSLSKVSSTFGTSTQVISNNVASETPVTSLTNNSDYIFGEALTEVICKYLLYS